MSVTIGFRASPNELNFAVYDSVERSVINSEVLRIPSAFAVPDGLKFVRSNVLDILREFEVESAGIRTTEPFAQSIDLRRVQLEGVIQEAFASSALRSFYAGPIAVIARLLKIDRDRFKPLIAGENGFGIEQWADMKVNAREAVLAAIGAANV